MNLSRWRILLCEIRNSAAAEKSESESEGGQKFLPLNPPPASLREALRAGLPFCPPERSVLVLPREARHSVGILFKMSSDFFQQTPPKFIYSGICLARGFASRFGRPFGPACQCLRRSRWRAGVNRALPARFALRFTIINHGGFGRI